MPLIKLFCFPYGLVAPEHPGGITHSWKMAEAAGGFPTFDQPVDFSDVVLVVEGRSFHVHKAILAKWSPVFKAMLTSDFKERSTNQITLPKKKACDVLELLQVLYPPEKPIDSQNVGTILSLAHEYQMACITNHCEKFLLTRQFNLQTLVTADEFHLEQLLTTSAQELAKESLKTQGIWDDEEFQQLKPETRLAVVENRLHNVSVAGDKVVQALTELLKNPNLSQQWFCDDHKYCWSHSLVFITKDAKEIPRLSWVNHQSRRDSLACSHCHVPSTQKQLLLVAMQLHHDDLQLSF